MSNAVSVRAAGIDIGSRTIELVVLENGVPVESVVTAAGFSPEATATALLAEIGTVRVMATGYGRQLLEISHSTPTVTEIKAYAVGARAALPDCRTILDIGGQDVKVIQLAEDGRVRKFEMNDRCAAGSGKFLEIMAQSLGLPLENFGDEALLATQSIAINSMCAVFAESEVTSLINRGIDRRDIAMAVHRSVATRAVGMMRRVGVVPPLLFAGGVALNPCMRRLLEESLMMPVYVPDSPQTLGALGAALLAAGL